MAITFRPRLWLGLGVSVLVQGAMQDAPAQPAPALPPPGLQDGEGGEGGEGGVEPGRAATQPVAYLAALDIMAAHVLAGRDAYAAGEPQAAAEMFAHAISEVHAEMEPVFAALGVAPFGETLERASTLALDRAPPPEVAAAVAGILDALRRAESRAPGRGATPGTQAAAIAEMVDRAAQQRLAAARDPGALEPYLDGYGLMLAARGRADRLLPALGPAWAERAAAIRAALDSLARAYPTPTPPPGAPAVSTGELLAQASSLRLRLDGSD
ncbi:hypothetical protein [Roseicella aquatilis]|uniref:Uncharacterized protein n=1 Tax=Roseicella aquatilis TaxID=2527868 RepID=A0A4R4DIA6_9PROT|nr:hypothetical protein [Roseicella aquatilis]TCZ60835.1 hypothetical protein EXY23_13755 [Roseicella aquatilis]